MIANRILIIANRIFKPSRAVKRHSPSIQRACICGIELQNPCIMSFCILQATQLHHRIGKHAMRIQILGKSANRLSTKRCNTSVFSRGNQIRRLANKNARSDLPQIFILNIRNTRIHLARYQRINRIAILIQHLRKRKLIAPLILNRLVVQNRLVIPIHIRLNRRRSQTLRPHQITTPKNMRLIERIFHPTPVTVLEIRMNLLIHPQQFPLGNIKNIIRRTNKQKLRRIIPQNTLRKNRQKTAHNTAELVLRQKTQGHKLNQIPARRQAFSGARIEINRIKKRHTRTRNLAKLKRNNIIRRRSMAQKIAPIFRNNLHARIAHPLRVKIFPNKRKKRRLNIHTRQIIDGIHQKTTNRLPCTSPHNNDPFGIRMQKHRHMRGHNLMVLFIPALPPAINLQLQIILPPDNRHIRAITLSERHEIPSLTDKIRRHLRLGKIRNPQIDQNRDQRSRIFEHAISSIQQKPCRNTDGEIRARNKKQTLLKTKKGNPHKTDQKRPENTSKRIHRNQIASDPRRIFGIANYQTDRKRKSRATQHSRRQKHRKIDIQITAQSSPCLGRKHQKSQHNKTRRNLKRAKIIRPPVCPIGKLSSQNTPQNQPNQHNTQRQRISINRIINKKPQIPHPQHLGTQSHKSNSKKQNKYNPAPRKPATHTAGRHRGRKHILPRNRQRANNKTTQNIAHNTNIDRTAQPQIRQKNKPRSRATQRSPQGIDTVEKANRARNRAAIARILTTKKRKRATHQNSGRQDDERNEKKTGSEPQEGIIAQNSIRDAIEKICKIKRIRTDQRQKTQTNFDIRKENKRSGSSLTDTPKKIRPNSQTQKKNRQNRANRKSR